MTVAVVHTREIVYVKNDKIDVIWRCSGNYLLRKGADRTFIEKSRERVLVRFDRKVDVLALLTRAYDRDDAADLPDVRIVKPRYPAEKTQLASLALCECGGLKLIVKTVYSAVDIPAKTVECLDIPRYDIA